MKTPYKIALAVAILAGAGTGAYFSGRRATQAKASATLKSTTGSLSNISCKLESRGYGKSRSTVKVCSADVMYTADGKQFTKNGFTWTLRNVGFLPPNDPKAGDQLTIYYEPATPQNIGIYNTADAAGFGWLCLAVVVAIVGVCAALVVMSLSDSTDAVARTKPKQISRPVADYAPVSDYAPDEFLPAADEYGLTPEVADYPLGPDYDPGAGYGSQAEYGPPAEYGSDEYFPDAGDSR
jgi:uncharacterized protein DUF3592